MAIDQQQDQTLDRGEQLLINGQLRPKNRFYVAVAEQAAKNKASGLPDPYPLKPLVELDTQGVSLSQIIIQDRGSY